MGINIKNNVKVLMEVAGKCGGFTRELAEEVGVKYRRLKQLEELNYISKARVFTVKEGDEIKTKYVYTLAREGEKFLEKESLCIAPVSLNGYEHTKAAEKVYLELRKDYEPNAILNESEQRYHLFKEDIKEIESKNIEYSIVDFCILKDNDDMEFIEVITENYRKSDFIKKQSYCNHFNKSPKYKK
ncbi:hypothetical protein [Romboutsia hominis]|uniref:hypothetical protein n=1 Tax=Romboutsia hominis TaxID=1507512 RepID=UPI001F055240|nr:hypothetical protein [Romboutsia hominis]MCH1959710.1 hypothetical protein [Romboutsia hominis]MCH1969867.1 hypothetical protein [Romboutsia hominis]